MSNNFTKKYTKKDLYLLNKYLGKFKENSLDKNVESIFKTKNYKITIYKNGTLLMQGTQMENVLKMINFNFKKNEIAKNDNEISLNKNIIGSDEVGTGDFFGGITICAVYIPSENISEVEKYNLLDSKKYTNNQIKTLFNKIKNLIKYEIVELSPNEYNNLYNKYNNLNILKTYGHQTTINKLVKNTNLNNFTCVIDEFANLKKYKEYLKNLNINSTGYEYTTVKAESKFIEVAAASIVARYYFINQIENLSKESNILIPFGSNYSKTEPALKSLKNKKLNPQNYLKLHFKNYK